jgi:hypothetical protein
MSAAAETNCAVHTKIEFSIAKGFSQRQKEQGDFHQNINVWAIFAKNWAFSFQPYYPCFLNDPPILELCYLKQ